MQEDKRATYLLLAGTILGVVFAATGMLQESKKPPAEAIVAEVNDWIIRRDDYNNFLQLLARDKRNPLTEEDKRHVLDRMIEEKLLIQRGVEIGLIQSDPQVRKTIANAMINSVVAETSSLQPDEDQLRAFFADNKKYFAKPARLRVQQLVFKKRGANDEVYARAKQAVEALQTGVRVAEVQQRFADEQILNIPNAMLPPHKLREYIGPTLLKVAEKMQPGGISQAQQTASGYSILLVLDNEPSSDTDFDKVRVQVENEYRRRAGDKALRDYLNNLRDEADVVLAPEFRTAKLSS
ncbi:MAG: peptidylprolyl isomerase [Pseudomonadales bacterium]